MSFPALVGFPLGLNRTLKKEKKKKSHPCGIRCRLIRHSRGRTQGCEQKGQAEGQERAVMTVQRETVRNHTLCSLY